MKETLKKLIDPSLLKTLIVCAVILYVAIGVIPHFYPKDNVDSENLQLEIQKLQYEAKILQYLHKVDSLETHITSLEEKKQNNITVGNQKKKTFRELTPTNQVVEFNTLFNTLTDEKKKSIN